MSLLHVLDANATTAQGLIASGKAFTKVVVTLTPGADGKALSYELGTAHITSIADSDDGTDASSPLTEQLDLVFKTIKATVGDSALTWDISAGKVA